MDFLIHNSVLVLLVIVSGAMLAWPLVAKRKDGATVTNEEAIEFINKKNAQLIDVRDHKEYKRGSIANAVNIPFENFADRLDQVAKDRPIIVVDSFDNNSTKAAGLLRDKGYVNVYVLKGGLNGWVSAGLPFSR